MRMKGFSLAGLIAWLVIASASVANADVIIGSTTPFSTAAVFGGCPHGTSGQDVLFQYTQGPDTTYTVPAGGGLIESWSTDAAHDLPGEPLTLVLLRKTPGHDYLVVGTDAEMLPSPLPFGVSTFNLTTPIVADAGDILGLYSSSSAPTCSFGQAGDTANTLNELGVPTSAPIAGQTLSIDQGPGQSPPAYQLDASADVAPLTQDAGVTTAAAPPNAAAGRQALLSSSVTNSGPGTGPITFVDHVPAGTTIASAVAGLGTCLTSGQTVTCTINGLTSGQSAPVDVVVTPTGPGNYANIVSVAVAAEVTDPNAFNNNAAATLAVGPAVAAPMCVVPKRLINAPATLAKTVLGDLGCNTKTTHKHSKNVHSGDVINTTPGAGTYPEGRLVTVSVSSGPNKRKRHSVSMAALGGAR
jgi:hypothetical protein